MSNNYNRNTTARASRCAVRPPKDVGQRVTSTRPMTHKRVSVLSLFSGMAGDAAAFALAGIPHKLVAVAEIDPAACA